MVSPSSGSGAGHGEQDKGDPADDKMRTERLNHRENSPGATGYSSSSPNESVQYPVPKIGRYQGIRGVGEGGMAEVYLAHDEVLGRDVALKLLRRGHVDEQLVERFRREARSAAALSHPNVVAIYDWGVAEDSAYYLVMEYVPGGTLKDFIDREGPLSAEQAVDVVVQTARALEAAHGRGMVHRDIKPQNILLDGVGGVKVTDFGIARAAKTPAMTEPGSIVGTVHYISPEQATGDPVGPASDLYSLGVVLYEMLTGQVPYDAEDPIAIVMKHLEGDLRPPKEINQELPEGLNAVVTKLLAKEPGDRYPDVPALIEALEQTQSQGFSPAPPGAEEPEVAKRPEPDDSDDFSRTKERSLRFLPVVGIAAFLVATVIGVGLWLLGAFSWTGEALLGRPESVEVSDVVGRPREAAVEILDSKGFDVRVGVRESSPEDEGMVVDQEPRNGELESGGTVDLWVGQEPPPEKDAELLRREVRDYYGAVDRGEWSYTYSHLDSETQALFTEEEWSRRNQFLADNYPGELSSVRVNVDINPGEPADVAVYRTFKSGAYNVRDTLFVYEDGAWKHRLTGKELEPFLVDLSYEEFVSYYGGT